MCDSVTYMSLCSCSTELCNIVSEVTLVHFWHKAIAAYHRLLTVCEKLIAGQKAIVATG